MFDTPGIAMILPSHYKIHDTHHLLYLIQQSFIPLPPPLSPCD